MNNTTSSNYKFHFVGVCGTAMGAVASALARQGHTVVGSDANVYPPMSDFLAKEGIKIIKGYKAENIPADATHIIIGNAISRGNPEAEAILNSKKRYLSLPEAMKEFFLWGKRNFVVTGTHGKTTTTSILAWLFEDNQYNPSYMIGGIAKNLGRGGNFTNSSIAVLEGDEYDTAFFDKRSKFLHYLPELVIMGNIEFDHADIYKNVEEIKKSFKHLLRVVPQNGLTLYNGDDTNCCDVVKDAPCPVKSVGYSDTCDIKITPISSKPEGSEFSIQGHTYFIPMVGEFNERNAAMATCAALFAGLTPEQIRPSLAKFQGIKRRQEIIGIKNDITVIDDFAHHPTAIQEAIKGIRQRFPQNKIWAIFDPRSNTQRLDIMRMALAKALKTADVAIVSKIEKPGKIAQENLLNIPQLISDITKQGTEAHTFENVDKIVDYVTQKAQPGDVIIAMSNGGFDNIHQKLLDNFPTTSKE